MIPSQNNFGYQWIILSDLRRKQLEYLFAAHTPMKTNLIRCWDHDSTLIRERLLLTNNLSPVGGWAFSHNFWLCFSFCQTLAGNNMELNIYNQWRNEWTFGSTTWFNSIIKTYSLMFVNSAGSLRIQLRVIYKTSSQSLI